MKRTKLKDPKESSKLSMRKLRAKDALEMWLKKYHKEGDLFTVTHSKRVFVLMQK